MSVASMKRATLNVDTDLAFHNGEDRHPQVIVRQFCHQHGVAVTDAIYEPRSGAWTFEVETEEKQLPLWPAYIVARPRR